MPLEGAAGQSLAGTGGGVGSHASLPLRRSGPANGQGRGAAGRHGTAAPATVRRTAASSPGRSKAASSPGRSKAVGSGGLPPSQIGHWLQQAGWRRGGWPVNTGLRSEPTMAAFLDGVYLVEGVIAANSASCLRLQGKPKIWDRSDDDGTFGVVHPLEGIVLELEIPGGGLLVVRCLIFRVDGGDSRLRGAARSR
jgi:hypothetical protein